MDAKEILVNCVLFFSLSQMTCSAAVGKKIMLVELAGSHVVVSWFLKNDGKGR